jgi:hypothetical protein
VFAEDGTESIVDVGVFVSFVAWCCVYLCVAVVSFACLHYVMCCIVKLLMFYVLYMPYTIIYELCVEYSTV